MRFMATGLINSIRGCTRFMRLASMAGRTRGSTCIGPFMRPVRGQFYGAGFLGLPNRMLNPIIPPQTLIPLSRYLGWDKYKLDTCM